MRVRCLAGVLMGFASVAGACTDEQHATATTPVVTAVVTQPPPTQPPSTQATTTAPASTVVTSTTIPAPEVVTRPYVDPRVCGQQAKTTVSMQLSDWVPFAVGPPQSMPIQVFAQATDGVAQPFAVVLRMADTSNRRVNDHPVTINGAEVSVDIVGNGNASAAWSLPDGTWAYLRGRDLDEAAITALITRLTPRPWTDPIPGFDLAGSGPTAPGNLVLVHEHLNSGVSFVSTRFQCTAPSNWIYRVDAEMGDPVAVYVSVIDRPRAYAVAVNGAGALAIGGPTEQLITLGMIVNADQTTWDALPEISVNGG
jgi:hypothetical protein